MRFFTRLGPLNVFAVAGKSCGDLLEHCVEIPFRDHTLRVLNLEMLIPFKETSTDPKELLRLPVLEEALRQLRENTGAGKRNKR